MKRNSRMVMARRVNAMPQTSTFWERNRIGLSILMGFLGGQLIADGLYQMYDFIGVSIFLVVMGIIMYFVAGQIRPVHMDASYGLMRVQRTPLDAMMGKSRPTKAIRFVCDAVGSTLIATVIWMVVFAPSTVPAMTELIVGVIIIALVGLFALGE